MLAQNTLTLYLLYILNRNLIGWYVCEELN